jgi:integrase
MGNCGFTQSDVSDLKDQEVDWKEGRITRKRSKTSDDEGVPVVEYKLWDVTFDLLKEYRSGGESVLLTETGKPWVYEKLVDGKMRSTDNVASNFTHLKAKLKRKGIIAKPLKLIRKTSASLLGTHEVYGRYSSHFLGHSPRSIADRHYVKPSRDLFDKAIAWLAQQYGY